MQLLAPTENKGATVALRFSRTIMFSVLAALVLLPSVTFGIVPAEIFPWALIFAGIYTRRLHMVLFFLLLWLTLSSTVVVLSQGVAVVPEVLRSLSAYLNVLIIFWTVLSMPENAVNRFSKVAKFIFITITLVGIMQLSGYFAFLDTQLKMFVPRAYAYSLDFMGGRGVTLFSSEPARAGIEFVSIYLIYRTTLSRDITKCIGDIALGLFMLVFIKSVAALAFYIGFMAIFYRRHAFIVGPTALALVVLVILYVPPENNRVVAFVHQTMEAGGASDAWFTLLNSSGHRIISILAGYQYGMVHPFGSGVGNWQEASVEALNSLNYDLSRLNYFKLYGDGEAIPIRFSGFVTNFIVDTGVFGVLVLFVFFYVCLRRYWRISTEAKSIILLFFSNIAIFGSVGNPVVWVSTALCLRLLHGKTLVHAR